MTLIMKPSLSSKLIIIFTFVPVLYQMVESLEFMRNYFVRILTSINFRGVTVCQLTV